MLQHFYRNMLKLATIKHSQQIMIDTIHLFKPLDNHLINLLKDLLDEEWNHPTLCRAWTVKDIVAHLLDGNFRRIAIHRDKYFGNPASKNQDLLVHLNEMNAIWVNAADRLSPRLLIDLLSISSEMYIGQFKALDPMGTAVFPVSWAGDKTSSNWFDIAREYTEKWLHQEQIRIATGRETLVNNIFFPPFLDTLMLGMPHALQQYASASVGDCIAISIPDQALRWFFINTENGWKKTTDTACRAELMIPAATAWQVFSKGISPDTALETCTIKGDLALAKSPLYFKAFMV